jgi:Family of unknown function (DUF5675)
MSDNIIKLERFAYLPTGTFGRLTFPTGENYVTAERPWLDNTVGESCIPEGLYALSLRPSAIVAACSHGIFDEGWEVRNVPGRTFIMIHPGNWPMSVRGCIAVGRELEIMPDGFSQYGVTNSRDSFSEIMGLMTKSDNWQLNITVKHGILWN